MSILSRIRETNQLSSVGLPSSNLLPTHRKVDSIDLDAVSGRIPLFVLVYQTLVEISICSLVQTSRETEIRQL